MDLQGSALADAVKAGAKAQKKAVGFTSGSVFDFRFGPEWDQVARFAQEAAGHYRRCGVQHRNSYVEASVLQAQANDKSGSYNAAAIALEGAADALSKDKGREEEAAVHFASSARYYRLNGQADKASTQLMRAAKLLEVSNFSKAMELMETACSIYEDEEKPVTSEQTFKKTIAMYIAKEKWSEALAVFSKQASVYQKMMDVFENDLYKSYLSCIIIHCHTDNLDGATKALRLYEMSQKFYSSPEFDAASDLIQSMGKMREDIEACIKKYSCFLHLDNCISRMASKLKEKGAVQVGGGARRSSAGHEEKKQESDSVDLS